MQRAPSPQIEPIAASRSWLDIRLTAEVIAKAEKDVQQLIEILNSLSIFKWGSNQIFGTELASKYADLASFKKELFTLLHELRKVPLADFLLLDENGNIQRDGAGAIKIHKEIDFAKISSLSGCLRTLIDRCRQSKKAQSQFENVARLLTDISNFTNHLSRSIDDALLIETQRHYQAKIKALVAEKNDLLKTLDETGQRFNKYLETRKTNPESLQAKLAEATTQSETLANENTELKKQIAALRLEKVNLELQITRQKAALDQAELENRALQAELSKPIPERKHTPSWRQVFAGSIATFGLIMLAGSIVLSLTGIGATIGIPALALSLGMIAGASLLLGGGGFMAFNLITAKKEDTRFKKAKQAYYERQNSIQISPSNAKINRAIPPVAGN